MSVTTILTSVNLISKLKDELPKVYNFTKDEVSAFFNKGIEHYLDNQLQKYSYTKTFLYQDNPVYFFDLYFPLTLSHRSTTIAGEGLSNLITNNKYLIIKGGAGSGKTMLMKYFFLNAYKEYLKVPIFIEFRDFSSYDHGFQEHVFEVILENKVSPNDRIMQRLLKEGKFIFILDGYDELEHTKKQKITSQINAFIDKYSNNNYIISSRPEAGLEGLNRFVTCAVDDLEKEQILTFIQMQKKNYKDRELLEKIEGNFEVIIVSQISHFLQNPLLLS